jgi:hypothetical protein
MPRTLRKPRSMVMATGYHVRSVACPSCRNPRHSVGLLSPCFPTPSFIERRQILGRLRRKAEGSSQLRLQSIRLALPRSCSLDQLRARKCARCRRRLVEGRSLDEVKEEVAKPSCIRRQGTVALQDQCTIALQGAFANVSVADGQGAADTLEQGSATFVAAQPSQYGVASLVVQLRAWRTEMQGRRLRWWKMVRARAIVHGEDADPDGCRQGMAAPAGRSQHGRAAFGGACTCVHRVH